MNIECFREVLNNLTMSEIIGDNSAYTVEELCEVFDNIKNIIKGEALKRTQITSNTPQKIMKLYAANFSPEEIADMLNLSVEEVSLVTTTSDNEITSIAQRMYKNGMPIGIMAEILNVPVEMVENMFGISDEVDEYEQEKDLSSKELIDLRNKLSDNDEITIPGEIANFISEEVYKGDN